VGRLSYMGTEERKSMPSAGELGYGDAAWRMVGGRARDCDRTG
jgi:hypothetical protein